MNDPSPGEPRFDEPPASSTRQVAASDWNRAEIEADPEPPPPRERLFPRKVLIGWALVALVLYFGVRLIGTVVKDTVKGEIMSRAAEKASHKSGRIVITTPDGQRIVISREIPPAPAKAATATPPATAAPPATAPPAAPKR